MSARPALAALALAGLVAAGTAICLLAAGGASDYVPAAWHGMPGWLAGPLPRLGDEGLTDGTYGPLFLAMCGCYLAALALGRHAPLRLTIAAIVALHLVFTLAPPLLSADVFGYITWARIGTTLGLDPYTHGPLAAAQDPVFEYQRWRTNMPSPYGPLFTLASYAVAPLGVAASLWAFKLATGAAGLAIVWLVHDCAHRLKAAPVPAIVLVGLNPIVLVWGIGGAHNDVFATLAILAGVRLAIGARPRAAGAATAAAAALKASAVLTLPFLIARHRGEAAKGAAAAAVAALVLTLVVFGTDSLGGMLDAQRDQQNLVALYSVPNQLGELLGHGGITPAIRTLALAALIATLILLVLRTWRGQTDWIAAAGWATLATIVTSAWLLPWYVIWLLPLAALGRDRRLVAATLVFCAYVVVLRTPL